MIRLLWLAALSLVLLSPLAFCGGVNASGGEITAVNVSLLHASDRWQVFYGNASSNDGNNSTTLSITSSLAFNLSDSGREVSFPSTYLYYLVSNDSSPFSGNFSVPSLSAVDGIFGLSGYSSSSYVFSNTSDFTLYTSSDGNNTTLSLPTLYLAGQNASGSVNDTAFREGIVKRGSSYLFIVPVSSAQGFDSHYYDYQFALPYQMNGYHAFNIFAVSEPLPPPSQGAPPPKSSLQSLPLSWSYDGSKLSISTVPQASVSVRDELGSTRNGQADASGLYTLSAPPGFKYYVSVSKSGYIGSELSIYIPNPEVVINKTEIQPPIPANNVSVQQTPSGPVVCIGSDCYAGDFSDQGGVQKLTELSCSGSICRFVGISEADFIEKYKLRRVPLTPPSPSNPGPSSVNIGDLFSNLGYELSSGLGAVTQVPDRDRSFFLYVSTFLAIAAIIIYVFKTRFSGRSFSGGYD